MKYSCVDINVGKLCYFPNNKSISGSSTENLNQLINDMRVLKNDISQQFIELKIINDALSNLIIDIKMYNDYIKNKLKLNIGYHELNLLDSRLASHLDKYLNYTDNVKQISNRITETYDEFPILISKLMDYTLKGSFSSRQNELNEMKSIYNYVVDNKQSVIDELNSVNNNIKSIYDILALIQKDVSSLESKYNYKFDLTNTVSEKNR